MGTNGIDLRGAVDFHMHFGPDALFERSVTVLDAAREAAAAGHAGLCLKSHDFPTPVLAQVVTELVADIAVIGGICCDRSVGGLNLEAIETTLRLGGKVVWLPTLTSRHDFEQGTTARVGLRGPPVDICDDAGKLVPEMHDVIALVRENAAVLATGHIGAVEHFAVAKACRDVVPLVVTHAMETLAGPRLTPEQVAELAGLGAMIEFCALTCLDLAATTPVNLIADTIRSVGASRCVIATDFGQSRNPSPVKGLQLFADALASHGLTEQEIRTMACANPRELLGVE